MVVELSEDEKVNIFKEEVLESDIFINHGFSTNGKCDIFYDNVLGTQYTIKFETKNRYIELSLYVVFEFINCSDALAVIIGNIDDNEEYVNCRYFLMAQWLAKHNMYQKTNRYPFNLSSYEGDYRQKIQHFLEFLRTVFYNQFLNNILSGNTWECIPIEKPE